MANTIHPFLAAFYSKANRARIAHFAVADLDTAESLWGDTDSSFAFRNVLVGSPEQRSEIWQAWISAKEIELAESPAFYVLNQQYEFGAQKLSRWAVFAALDVHSQQIYIHEDVLPEGVERARQSMEACEGDMAPIFVGCAKDLGSSLRKFLEEAVVELEPMLDFVDGHTSSHRIWKLEGIPNTLVLQEMFLDRGLYLLDGHHRLAAARENSRLGIGDGKIFACICSMEPEDTLILPIHRAVYCERWTLEDALIADLVRAGCEVIEQIEIRPQNILQELEKIPAGNLTGFALYAHSNRVLKLRLPRVSELPPALADLPVAALDYGILRKLPDLTIIPVPDFKLALEQLAMDQAQVAFFLPAVAAEQVRVVARAALKMPRKSTRFVPKPALGLLCRPWS